MTTERITELMASLKTGTLSAITETVALLNEACLALDETAELLEWWAMESRCGGWSTHQVGPMRTKADELRKRAAGFRLAGRRALEKAADLLNEPYRETDQ